MRIWCRYEWKMRKIFRGFLDSFKLDKDFGYTFLADAVTFSLIFTAFTLFASYIQEKSVGIMQGTFDRRDPAVSLLLGRNNCCLSLLKCVLSFSGHWRRFYF